MFVRHNPESAKADARAAPSRHGFRRTLAQTVADRYKVFDALSRCGDNRAETNRFIDGNRVPGDLSHLSVAGV
jgi:hypothetical protein